MHHPTARVFRQSLLEKRSLRIQNSQYLFHLQSQLKKCGKRVTRTCPAQQFFGNVFFHWLHGSFPMASSMNNDITLDAMAMHVFRICQSKVVQCHTSLLDSKNHQQTPGFRAQGPPKSISNKWGSFGISLVPRK